MRVAIASSGLGHVHRGVESWAEDLARTLRADSVPVTLFQGAGQPADDWRKALSCMRRFDPATLRYVRFFRRLGGWRYGLGSGYEIEQTTFALQLWRHVRRGFDVVHVQDPWLALILDRLNRRGLSRPRVILAHGTEESPAFLNRLRVIQHLAPCYLSSEPGVSPSDQKLYAIPNFVDTSKFHPGDRRKARSEFDLPPQATVVLCTAAIKRSHKRIDFLIREVAEVVARRQAPLCLVVAGAREADTEELIAMGREALGDCVRFFVGVPRERMPVLLQCADVFALASLHEMMPIAVLEALATGLPVLANDTATLRWMVGPGGMVADLTRPGTLAASLDALMQPAKLADYGARARRQAEDFFSPEVVVPQITAMYRDIVGDLPGRPVA